MTTLITICSKFPNPLLYTCIDTLYKIQIGSNRANYKICVVDSDSSDMIYYRKVQEDFPDIEIYFIKNKHYEYGAYAYTLAKYPDFDNYICLQDSLSIYKQIDLQHLNNTTVFAFNMYGGYLTHLSIKGKGIALLKDSGLEYEHLIHKDFTLVQHSSFIVNNTIMKDIFKTFQHPPIDKEGSCSYERNFALYFILKHITTLNLYNYMNKVNGGRW
jgi:hypothetical protein